MCNSLNDNFKTAWLTEYQATIYTKNTDLQIERFEKVPVPDYIRWFESSDELHYLTFEARTEMPQGDYDQP